MQEVTKTLDLIGLETDKGHSSCEHGMAELRDRFARQTSTIQCLKAETERHTADRQALKEKLSLLIEDGIEAKRCSSEWASRYRELKASSESEIAELRQRISRQSELLETARHEQRQTTGNQLHSTQAYEQLVSDLRGRLATTGSRLERAEMTRDRAVSELVKMKDDSRKLLKTLGHDTVGKGGGAMSLEHARNLTYVNRRQKQPGKVGEVVKLASIAENEKAAAAVDREPLPKLQMSTAAAMMKAPTPVLANSPRMRYQQGLQGMTPRRDSPATPRKSSPRMFNHAVCGEAARESMATDVTDARAY